MRKHPLFAAKNPPRFVVLTGRRTSPARTPTGNIKGRSDDDRIRELSVAPLLAEAVYRVHKSMPFAELLTWNVTVRAVVGVLGSSFA